MFRRQLIHCLMVAMLFLINLCGLRGSPMSRYDDDLSRFEKAGAKPLPQAVRDGYVVHAGANISYSIYGSGPTVILLHGGLGNSRNWGYQVPALVDSGYTIIDVWCSDPFNYHSAARALCATGEIDMKFRLCEQK